jgi:hypothetical protein
VCVDAAEDRGRRAAVVGAAGGGGVDVTAEGGGGCKGVAVVVRDTCLPRNEPAVAGLGAGSYSRRQPIALQFFLLQRAHTCA